MVIEMAELTRHHIENLKFLVFAEAITKRGAVIEMAELDFEQPTGNPAANESVPNVRDPMKPRNSSTPKFK
jgi:hypothetical protein